MHYQTDPGDDRLTRAALTLAGVTSRGGRRAASRAGRLDGLTLTPQPGALTVLLGDPGDGGPALLRAVAGVQRVRGTITLDNADPPSQRGIGAALRPYALFPHRTLARNVALGPGRRATPRLARAALLEQALDLFQLAERGGLRAGRATPGERVRAVLARAVASAPRVLLLDEPFLGAVPGERGILFHAIRRAHALLGATTLLATSDAAAALAVADDLAVLRHGTVVQHGPAASVFDDPCDATTAAMLGEVNLLHGHVETVEDDTVLVRLACGPLVEARGARAPARLAPCLLAVRPDRIAVAAASAEAMGDGAIDARLVEARFEGQSWRLELLIGSGARVVVRRPASVPPPAPGHCALAWQPYHAQAFG